jgi:hypothetical protein
MGLSASSRDWRTVKPHGFAQLDDRQLANLKRPAKVALRRSKNWESEAKVLEAIMFVRRGCGI